AGSEGTGSTAHGGIDPPPGLQPMVRKSISRLTHGPTNSRRTMHKTIGVSMTALALLFGAAGVSHATENAAPVPSTVTTLAQETTDDGGDSTGLWGLAGLLGLVGL